MRAESEIAFEFSLSPRVYSSRLPRSPTPRVLHYSSACNAGWDQPALLTEDFCTAAVKAAMKRLGDRSDKIKKPLLGQPFLMQISEYRVLQDVPFKVALDPRLQYFFYLF